MNQRHLTIDGIDVLITDVDPADVPFGNLTDDGDKLTIGA